MSNPSAELQSTLQDLSIGGKGPIQDLVRPIVTKNTTSNPKIKKSKQPVADSWEDEAESSDEELLSPSDSDKAKISFLSPTLSATSAEGPLDPPPTPISPQVSRAWGAASPVGQTRRPEKQTAVASRLIAGALGIRAPKRTEEERAYDRATKEQEIKRRNREREEQAKAKENEERAKASVWTD
ncbi:hypothetical protein N7495_002664 [Penicillium taxi]|uniref:uncharacterized protein n=1 Tax=Penicillium taxi TaxID=168475 RepID=UPI002545A78B|nr:uncharacterized protein N7495_002664 [Penicillium taxi]KAJ5902136.1 hypothetical protein N7495_002664 [Penicillium taxi]